MLLRLSLTTTFTPTHSRNHMTCTNAGIDVETQQNCESAKLVETRGNWEKACRNAVFTHVCLYLSSILHNVNSILYHVQRIDPYSHRSLTMLN